MARKPDRLHENFRRALEEAPLRSTLGRWMTKHREDMEQLLQEGVPDWGKMADAFGKAGLLDDTERKPSAGSTERIWRVVKAATAPKPAAATARAKGRGQPRTASAASR
jgi:hypothetical protein